VKPSETPEPTATLVPRQAQPQYVTAVLLGMDRDQEGIGLRTDTFVIVTLRIMPGAEQEIEEAVVLSIPRDTLVDVLVDGIWTKDRINVAYLRGGFEGLRETVKQNFGLFVNAGIYAIDFDGFIQVADMMGGLTITPKESYFDWCGDYKGFLHSGKGGYDRNWKVGVAYDMGGAELLCYIRARTQSDDVARTRRAQDVLLAMRDNWLPTIISSPTIWPDLFSLIKTDLRLDEAIDFLPLADAFQRESIPLRTESMEIGRHLKYGKTATGASVLIPLVDLKVWANCQVTAGPNCP
jgi:LCP family protein required for cell wall assembly